MNKIYLLPFNSNHLYLDAYKTVFGKRLVFLSGIFTPLKILFLPLRARLIIEDIHVYWYLILLRFDIEIIHIPRGGSTFKIGWKDSNVSKRIKLKLLRRDYIIIASDFFIDFFKDQEFISKKQMILVRSEPILEKGIKNYNKNMAEKTLLMLGDRATKENYYTIINNLPDQIKKKLIVTIHPRLDFRISEYPSEYSIKDIKNVISDGSISSVLMFSAVGVDLFILSDFLCSRPMWIDKNLVYKNMTSLDHLSTAIENNNKSILKINVSTESISDSF